MIGAIIGDICGSVYEFNPVKSSDFELMADGVTYTDDTVLSVAVADAVLYDKPFAKTIKEYAKRYPDMSYGHRFRKWVNSESLEPYNSFGNGSAMRVAAIGFYYNDEESVLEAARKSAEVTHNHPEGIKGAQAIALGIFLAREAYSKKRIKEELESHFGYNLSRSVEMVAANYGFNETCQGSVPEAIIAFLDSKDFESAIRNAIMLKGDADTQACMAGALAQAYYGDIPIYMKEKMYKLLPQDLHRVVKAFIRRPEKFTKAELWHRRSIGNLKYFLLRVEQYKEHGGDELKREILSHWISILPVRISYLSHSDLNEESRQSLIDSTNLRWINMWIKKWITKKKVSKPTDRELLEYYDIGKDLIEEWSNKKAKN